MTEFSFYTDGNPQNPEEIARMQAQQAAQQQRMLRDQLMLDGGEQFSDRQKRIQNLAFFAFIIVFFLVPAGIVGMIYRNAQSAPQELVEQEAGEVIETGEVQGVSTEDPAPIAPVNVRDRLFYIRDNNVYAASKTGEEITAMTSYATERPGAIADLNLIDENHLGFYMCSPGSGCDLIRLDIASKETSIVQHFEDNIQLIAVAWETFDAYAYSYHDIAEERVTVKYRGITGEKTLAEFGYVQNDRDRFIEDDLQMSFSPSGEFLYYIYTQGQDGFDFTIYVYDTSGVEVDRIPDATMPDWYDDRTIVYRGYSNQSPGFLYIRDLTQNRSTKIQNSSRASYHPQANNSRITYWTSAGLGMTYVYDAQSLEVEVIGVNAAYPLWLSENEVLFASNRKCFSDECTVGTIDFETQFVKERYYIQNLDTDEEYEVAIPVNSIEGEIVTWYNRRG